ncbi:MAG: sporulation initiation factor Spo0A C-terminal domain-containing protein [Christensenellales bacterium]
MKDNGRIYRLLLELGVFPSRNGFRYLYELLVMATDGADIYPLKKKGYRILAEKYGKNPENIDKSVQNAISCMFEKGDMDKINEIFGNTIDENRGKAGNKQFICTVSEYLNNI